MWQMFTNVMPDTTTEQSRAALILLGMVGNVEPSVIMSNINVLVEHGLETRDMKFAHDTCVALQRISSSSSKSQPTDIGPCRLDPDHKLFVKLENLLINGIGNKKDDQYVAMAQQAIMVIYNLSDKPDDLAGKLCRKLAQKIRDHPRNTMLLRRAFFVVGHIAVCQVSLFR